MKDAKPNLKLVKRGRPHNPAEILPNGLEALEAAASRGLSTDGAAHVLGISGTCLRECMQRDEAAQAAWRAGLATLEQELVGRLLAQSREGSIAATIFALKNRCGWSDSGPRNEQAPVAHVRIELTEPMSREQYRAQLVETTGNEAKS